MAAIDPRLERLLTMIPFIIKNQPVGLDELSRVFGVQGRQVKKDLELLWVCGTPDYYPDDLIDVLWEGGQVSLRMADYFFRPLHFTRQELAALRVAAEALQDLSALPETESLTSALDKIAATLQMESSTLQSVPVHLEQAPAHHLETLRAAEAARTQVQMEYYTWGRESFSERRFEPHSLFYALGNWYVSGWDHASGEVRIFRLDRIRNLEETDEPFARPPEPPDEQALFSFASGASVEVRLKFDATLGLWASEQSIYENMELLPDGSALCSLKTDSLSWLEKDLLRLGPHVTVLEPQQLRRSLAERLERILRMYLEG